MMLLESDIIQAIETVEAIQPWEPNLIQLVGYFPMSIVTILLIALVFAAWKAPARVKEIGLFTLALGFLWTTIGLIMHGNVMQGDGDAAPNIVWWGLKCWLIPFAYSIIVYIFSLIIRIIRKWSDRSVRRRAKGIGLLALALGLLWIPIGLIQTSDLMQVTGDATLSAIWLGVERSLIPFACGLIVYIMTLIIRIALKPSK